jgi:hypothetical protein
MEHDGEAGTDTSYETAILGELAKLPDDFVKRVKDLTITLEFKEPTIP